MRSSGLILLFGGILVFLYCTSRLSALPPVSAEVELSDYLRYEAGKWELGRYVSAGLAGIGFLLALFPKGR
jgi:hypothetical protein